MSEETKVVPPAEEEKVEKVEEEKVVVPEVEDAKETKEDWAAIELARLQKVEEEKQALEERLAEKERQVLLKDAALAAEKKKTRPESADRESLKREVLTEIRVDSELSRMSATDAERKLIMHHYESSIVKTGDVKEDLKRAHAVANASRMQELLSRQSQEDAADDTAASSMLGTGYGSERGPSNLKSPARKEAESIISGFKSLSPEMKKKALKNLENYLPR